MVFKSRLEYFDRPNIVYQVGQRRPANLSRDQAVYGDSPIFYTKRLLEQERPKWLPETRNKPKRLRSLVQCSRATCSWSSRGRIHGRTR